MLVFLNKKYYSETLFMIKASIWLITTIKIDAVNDMI